MGAPSATGARSGSSRSSERSSDRTPDSSGSGPGDDAGLHSFGWTGDRRHESTRASLRRRAAEDALLDALLLPHDLPTPQIGNDGQALLIKALGRLARQDDVAAAVVWTREPSDEIRVIAAQPADAAHRIEAALPAYRALARIERVTRLTDGGLDPALEKLAQTGVSAAAPVPGLGHAPAAMILLLPKAAGRPMRPRTIAILAEVSTKLGRSLSTSLALERMGALDGAVRRLDRLAALGSLVSEIVHEIRNPLVSVKTFLQLLPDRLDDPEFHGDFRTVVGDEVSRLERMLDDLLRQARPTQATSLVPGAQIAEAIETTLQLMTYRCREKGVELESEIRSELPSLDLSQDELRQVLLNLLLNATDVTPSGGRIRIAADWSQSTANHVELVIEDEGPGIDAETRAQIFEPFWSTRPDRVGGLGLAISKRIVEESAGTIAIEERRSGDGACFRLELPILR